MGDRFKTGRTEEKELARKKQRIVTKISWGGVVTEKVLGKGRERELGGRWRLCTHNF